MTPRKPTTWRQEGDDALHKLRPFITRESIVERVAELGRQITQDFVGEQILLLAVLKGAAIFLADLVRNIEVDATFDFIAVSSYGEHVQHSGEVKLLKDVDESLEGRNIILVEDIVDTGLTLSYLKNLLQARRPKQVKIAALLDKPSRRVRPVEVDYVGFVIPNEFVVGYGMDLAERYRILPGIFILESAPDAM
jgi:hypoxanthine phosphoribosyltransferase